MKHFITGTEFSPQELKKIITNAIDMKSGKIPLPHFSEKILTLLFANSSLRTRLSFESGMKKMKGNVNILDLQNAWNFEYKKNAVMNSHTQEHISESARVISRYSDLIAMRKCDLITKNAQNAISSSWSELKKDEAIHQLVSFSSVPVINMESNMFHPCQALADMQTITEYFSGKNQSVQQKKIVVSWVPHPKPLPLATPHSQFLTPAMFGMNVSLACPKGFELDSDVLTLAQKYSAETGGSIQIENDQEKAFENADVIVAKSWASLECFGNWAQEKTKREQYSDWTITKEKMQKTNNAIFMHCLPIRRNVIATDEVLDSSNSQIIEGAENRMWSQMALIEKLLE